MRENPTLHTALKWQFPNPFVSEWVIQEEHIDHYQHTNNVAYLSRLESLAWEHSASLGLTFADYQNLDRAMAITEHKLQYHQATHLNERLLCATWIVKCDRKFRLARKFQFFSMDNNKLVFSAETQFVCISLATGMPKKMPAEFANIYGEVCVAEDQHAYT